MKIGQLLSTIDKIKPNTIESEDKFEWINEIEGLIYNNIFAKAADTSFNFTPYDFEKDQDTDILVPAPYEAMYIHYLSAKIDFWEGDINSYNNNMSLYNELYDNFAAFYRRNNMPKGGY